MTTKEQDFARELFGNAKTHLEWKGIIQFGMPSLIENSGFLMDQIIIQAHRQMDRHKIEGLPLGEMVANIIEEIGLKIVVK